MKRVPKLTIFTWNRYSNVYVFNMPWSTEILSFSSSNESWNSKYESIPPLENFGMMKSYSPDGHRNLVLWKQKTFMATGSNQSTDI